MNPTNQREQGKGGQRIDQGPLVQALSPNTEKLKSNSEHEDAAQGTEFPNEIGVHSLTGEGKGQSK